MTLKRFEKYKSIRLLMALFFVALMGLVHVSTDAYAQYPGFSDPGERRIAGSGASGLVAVDGSVDGGVIPIGATAQVVVRFRNDGVTPMQTGLIRLYPSSTVSAVVSLNQCREEPLQPEAECAIALSVKGLQSGAWRVEMLMSHSGRSRLVTATLSGQVEAGGDSADSLSSDVETIPAEINFGSLNDSQTLVEPVVLRNITSTPLNLKNVYIDAGEQSGYALKTECEKLEAGQACIAIVSWSPKLKGRSSGVLVVEHDGPAGLSSVPLSGEFRPDEIEEADVFPSAIPGKGLLVSSQMEIDFGADIDTASTITVSLVNAGDTDLTLNDVKVAGSDNGLNFKDGGCTAGTVLKPVDACPLTLTWSPTRIGQLFDDVQILHDGARGVLVLPVRGEASARVSQDQKAIVVSPTPQIPVNRSNVDGEKTLSMSGVGMKNIASLLDGYRITSFSPARAIISGPGGSRIVFNKEETVIGGVSWYPVIQRNGIEFLHGEQRVLLLFDRSLSAVSGETSSSSISGATLSTSLGSDTGG